MPDIYEVIDDLRLARNHYPIWASVWFSNMQRLIAAFSTEAA